MVPGARRDHEGLDLCALHRSLVEDGCDGIVTIDADGRIVTTNAAAEEMAGIGRGQMLGMPVLDLVHPDDAGRALDDLAASAAHGAPRGTSSFRVRHSDGRWVQVDVTSSDVSDGERQLLGLFLRPAVDREAIDVVLMRLLAGGARRDLLAPVCDLFAWRANHTQVGVSWWEPGEGLAYESTGLPAELVGADAAPGEPWLRARGDLVELHEGVDLALDPARRSFADELGLGPFWIVPVADVGGRPPTLITVWGGPTGHPSQVHAYAMGVARTLVELILRSVHQGERLEQAAHTDELTGLANRKAFLDRLAAAHGEGALLFCDLDRFKAVNDQLGHPAGDELLRQVATRLRGAVRSGDLVARIGGDEFAVLCAGADRAAARAVADRIHEAISQPFRLVGAQVALGISIGIGHAPDHVDAEVLAAADRELYEVKAARRLGGDPGTLAG